jgi:hypothetical protein
MSVREHLANLHKTSAAFHTQAAGHHAALAECFGKSKTTDNGHALFQEHHNALSKLHSSHADWHSEQQEKCSKASDAADLEKANRVMPLPAGMSAVAPTPSHLKMVPRVGGAPAPFVPSGPAAPNVDFRFQKIFEVNDDENLGSL